MADAARAQRQAALEEKKRRLEELKARKQQRATTNVSAQAQVRIQASANLDDYIDGLLQVPAAANAAASDLSTIAANNSGAASKTVDENGSRTNANQPAPASEGSSVSSSAPAPAMALQPKAEVFEMGTQTSDDDFPLSDDGRDGEGVQQQTGDQQENKASRVDVTTDETVEEETSEEAKVLTAEEVEKELSSEAFSSFLNATSKKVERVLGSDLLADLLVDYDGKSDGSKRITTKTSDGSKYLSSRQIYECPKWTGSRDVTDMDWSPLHRELMLCGYHMRSSSSSLAQPLGSAATKVVSPDDTPSDSLNPRSGELLSDGLALVWNLAMPSRPEHIFTCGSPVTTVRFHPTEANLIIGGCQSGQVVVWDVRAGRMPVQKSVLTTTASGNSKGHTHPICAMEVIEGGVSGSERKLICRLFWLTESHHDDLAFPTHFFRLGLLQQPLMVG
jgi:dynein intermediate chain